jgi:hypothetical protein
MRLLDPLKKSLLLYGDSNHNPASPDRLVAYGELYEEEGRIHDALEFYWRAGFTEGLERIEKSALAEGDFFLYRQAMGYLGREILKEDLAAVMKNAQHKGKLSFALMAAREAGDEKAAALIEKTIAQKTNGAPRQEP